MKLSHLVANLFLALGLAATAQAQWIKLPLPDTPRTPDGKPNLTAPAPRTSDGHPDLSGIWISGRNQFTNPQGRGLERYMPAGSKVPMTPAAEKFYADRLKAAVARLDANDLLYQLDASREYNPAPKLETIKAPLVAVNSADDFINPPELGMIEREIKRVKRGRFIMIPISDQTRGHGTHTIAAIWQGYLKELLAQSER